MINVCVCGSLCLVLYVTKKYSQSVENTNETEYEGVH